MNVKNLKDVLASLPEGSDDWDVNFLSKECLVEIGIVTIGTWSDNPDEVPDGNKPGDKFLLLSCEEV